MRLPVFFIIVGFFLITETFSQNEEYFGSDPQKIVGKKIKKTSVTMHSFFILTGKKMSNSESIRAYDKNGNLTHHYSFAYLCEPNSEETFYKYRKNNLVQIRYFEHGNEKFTRKFHNTKSKSIIKTFYRVKDISAVKIVTTNALKGNETESVYTKKNAPFALFWKFVSKSKLYIDNHGHEVAKIFSKDGITCVNEYTYDSAGHLLTYMSYDAEVPAGRLEDSYKYNRFGYLIEHTDYRENGNIYKKDIYCYDENFLKNGDTIHKNKEQHPYYKKVSQDFDYKTGQMKLIFTDEYDKNGNMFHSFVSKPDGSDTTEERYFSYAFAGNGNLISSCMMDNMKIPFSTEDFYFNNKGFVDEIREVLNNRICIKCYYYDNCGLLLESTEECIDRENNPIIWIYKYSYEFYK